MNRLTVYLFATMTMFACNRKVSQNQQTLSHEGEAILIGEIDRSGLQSETCAAWFEPGYANYKVDTKSIDTIKDKLKATDILLFMGTWCEDSQAQVPEFFRILDAVAYDEKKLRIVSLDNHPDRYKTSPGGQEKGWDIHSVPTFIFLKEGKELGRIVEYPEKTLEKDMMAILK